MRLPVVILLFLSLKCGVALGAACTPKSEQTRLARVVAVDSTGGPVYEEQAKNAPSDQQTPSPLTLNDHEIVLTFDQGPNSIYTRYILDTLDHHCVKATFFFSGQAAPGNSKVLREVAERGHTIAAGPWSHAAALDKMTPEEMKSWIEKSLTSVSQAAGGQIAPFIRLPEGQASPEVRAYLASRNISLWNVDLASGDTEPGVSATRFANRTITRMQQLGKGVIQFHDTKRVTVDALDDILRAAKQGGFKVVHIVPGANFVPLAENVASNVAPPAAAKPQLVESAKRRVRSSEDRQRRQRIAKKRNREEGSE